MAEVGCYQEEPTVLYQDCKPAMSVAENRGSLAKKSKALDIRVFGIRNRLEDQHLELKYISTVEMVADLGTKNLGPVRFKFLRDIMNGYALVRASGRKVSLPAGAITLREMQRCGRGRRGQ